MAGRRACGLASMHVGDKWADFVGFGMDDSQNLHVPGVQRRRVRSTIQACVALFLFVMTLNLSARSYTTVDRLFVPVGRVHKAELASGDGRFVLGFARRRPGDGAVTSFDSQSWLHARRRGSILNFNRMFRYQADEDGWHGFVFEKTSSGWQGAVPYVWPLVLSGLTAVVSCRLWWRRRTGATW
jgi:hypothetical protein